MYISIFDMENDYEIRMLYIFLMYFRTLFMSLGLSATRIPTLCASAKQGCAFVGVQTRVGNAGVHLVVVNVAQMVVFWVMTTYMFISLSRRFEKCGACGFRVIEFGSGVYWSDGDEEIGRLETMETIVAN